MQNAGTWRRWSNQLRESSGSGIRGFGPCRQLFAEYISRLQIWTSHWIVYTPVGGGGGRAKNRCQLLHAMERVWALSQDQSCDVFYLRAVCLGNEVQNKVYHLYYGRICVSSLLEYVGDVAIRHFLEDFLTGLRAGKNGPFACGMERHFGGLGLNADGLCHHGLWYDVHIDDMFMALIILYLVVKGS